MRPPPWKYRTTFGFGLVVAALAGCTEEPPTSVEVPPFHDETTPCQAECTMVEDTRPLRAALARFADSDSAVTDVFLADFTMRGGPGGTVRATLVVTDDMLEELGATSLRVTIDGSDRLYTLAELRGGPTLFRFEDRGEVTVQYAIPRRLAAMPDGAIRLTQETEAVEVRSARTPWATAVLSKPVVNAMDPPCEATVFSADTVVCGVHVTINPFVTGGPFGGFQSGAGSGASDPITIAFSAPVSSVTLTVHDPDFAGNQLIARDAAGQTVAVADFEHDGQPNVPSSSTRTVTAPGIRSVIAQPAPADFVAYDDLIIVVGGAQTLMVQCTPNQVERGDPNPVTCTASAPGRPAGSAFRPRAWFFEGDQDIRVDRPIFEVPDTTWIGQIVLNGQVTVRATVADVIESATTTITVAPRDWSNLAIPFTVDSVPPDPELVTFRPDSSAGGFILGATIWSLDTVPVPVAVVPDNGPNAGVAFLPVGTIPYRWTAELQISPAILPNSDWWLLQPDVPPSPAPGACGRSWITDVIAPTVLAHEGINLEPGSHTEIIQSELRLILPSASEAAVGANAQALREFLWFIRGAARVAINRLHSDLDRPTAPWRLALFDFCRLLYFSPN